MMMLNGWCFANQTSGTLQRIFYRRNAGSAISEKGKGRKAHTQSKLEYWNEDIIKTRREKIICSDISNSQVDLGEDRRSVAPVIAVNNKNTDYQGRRPAQKGLSRFKKSQLISLLEESEWKRLEDAFTYTQYMECDKVLNILVEQVLVRSFWINLQIHPFNPIVHGVHPVDK